MSGDAQYERVSLALGHYEDTGVLKEVYHQPAAAADTRQRINLAATYYRPRRPSRTVTVFMHPISSLAHLPLIEELAAAGHHIVCCPTRYANDPALIMEKALTDLGGCIRHLKENLGYEKVVLGGWSGGGSLMAFYQSQAENPTITHTPAGDPYDLTHAGLTPADGVMLLAAHASRHQMFTEWIDASVLDEHNPDIRDRDLDLYAPDATHQPPYAAEFVERYRAAQIARNRRITTWVKAKLQHLRDTGRPHEEFGFVVHGTMADPRWLDPALDPNGRRPNWCYMGDPRMVNNGPTGLARFTTLRSWLSQWSYDDARGSGPTCVGDVTKPVLVVGMDGDDCCPPSHTRALYEGIKHSEKEVHFIAGVDHYVRGRPEGLIETRDLCGKWLETHDLR